MARELAWVFCFFVFLLSCLLLSAFLIMPTCFMPLFRVYFAFILLPWIPPFSLAFPPFASDSLVLNIYHFQLHSCSPSLSVFVIWISLSLDYVCIVGVSSLALFSSYSSVSTQYKHRPSLQSSRPATVVFKIFALSLDPSGSDYPSDVRNLSSILPECPQ